MSRHGSTLRHGGSSHHSGAPPKLATISVSLADAVSIASGTPSQAGLATPRSTALSDDSHNHSVTDAASLARSQGTVSRLSTSTLGTHASERRPPKHRGAHPNAVSAARHAPQRASNGYASAPRTRDAARSSTYGTPSSVLSSVSSNVPHTIDNSRGGGVSASSIVGGGPVPSLFSRVKVAVRCRPPFAEEGDAPAVQVMPPVADNALSTSLQIQVAPDKRREFGFDVVFGAAATNSDVYNVIGGPVVDGVLNGVNGTVMAYGQTGSGKTHSLGILTRVTGETGIIPRSLSHIFGAITAAGAAGSAVSYAVTLSFCQLYLDTIQDLLAPGMSGAAAAAAAGLLVSSHPDMSVNGANLNVREDPQRGFYVDGLSEYSVPSFDDAVALLNWGLENRVLGATRMNATSSRSHTVLTVRVETRTPLDGAGGEASTAAPGSKVYGFVTRRSQLMLCDLAGSERVRRTSSRGARLEEARAINASLHTLGQVIAALSQISSHRGDASRVHVPWRDSKLTRLLYGNLGGSSNTFLLATVGPDPRNASESLSTLLFASRCMRVAAIPVVAMAHTQADYADLCARLQARLSSVEGSHAGELSAMQARYEAALSDLQVQLEAARSEAADGAYAGRHHEQPMESFSVSLFDDAATPTLSSSMIMADSPSSMSPWYNQLCRLYDVSAAALLAATFRNFRQSRSWQRAIDRATSEEAQSSGERSAMSSNDPITTVGGSVSSPDAFGPHLGHEHKLASRVLAAIHNQHSSNSVQRPDDTSPAKTPTHLAGMHRQFSFAGAAASAATDAAGVSSAVPATARAHALLMPPALPPGATLSPLAMAILSGDITFARTADAGSTAPEAATVTASLDVHFSRSNGGAPSDPSLDSARGDGLGSSSGLILIVHPKLTTFKTAADLMTYCRQLTVCCFDNVSRLDALCAVKDARFDDVKRHLSAAESSVRLRDEDAANQRYVLRYLVDTTSQLRDEIRRLKASSSRRGVAASALGLSGADASSVITGGASADVSPEGSFLSAGESVGPHDRSTAPSTRGASPTGGLEDSYVLEDEDDFAFDGRPLQNLLRRRDAKGLDTRAPLVEQSAAATDTPLPPSSGDRVVLSPQKQWPALPATVVPAMTAAGPSAPPGMTLVRVASDRVPGHFVSSTASVSRAGDAVVGSATTATTAAASAVVSQPPPARPPPAPAAAAVVPASQAVLPPVPAAAPANQPAPFPVPAAAAASPLPAHMLRDAGAVVDDDHTQTVLIPSIRSVLDTAQSIPEEDEEAEEEDEDGGGSARSQLDDEDEWLPPSPPRAVTGAAASSEAGEDEDSVECIVGHRAVAKAGGGMTVMYRVRWKNSTPAEDEWFHREDLLHDFPHAVRVYEQLQAQAARAPAGVTRAVLLPSSR